MKKKVITVFVLALALALALIPAVYAAQIWEDNFDSYPTGTDLHGVGGWKGWGNDPTFTAFTTDVQANSTPNSVDIAGNSDLVQEYAVANGLVHYRFNQYIPSALAGDSYFIMLNQYDDAGTTNNWSVQVQIQGANGLLVDDGLSGATMPYVADQWVPVCLEIDLDQDTQEFIYNGMTFYTGGWSGHVSGGGITSIGAVDLFANGASSVYYDDMVLDTGACPELAPDIVVSPDFLSTLQATDTMVDRDLMISNIGTEPLDWDIEESEDPFCEVTTDVTWISTNPMSGTLAAGDTVTPTVTFDSTGVAAGTYTATLCVNSNDPDTFLIPVPVEMTVVEASIDVAATVGLDPAVCAADSSIVVGQPSTVVYYCYSVTNTGSMTLPLHDISDDLGNTLNGVAYDLAPGETANTVALGVVISDTVTTATSNTVTWTAYDPTNGVTATDTGTATVTEQPTDVSLSGFAGETGSNSTLLLVAISVAGIAGLGWYLSRRRTG